MTATITNHLGHTITGQIRCWMGRRIVEIETSDGRREIGRLTPDEPTPPSTVDTRDPAACTPADRRGAAR
jgi:hypothetical protein